MCFYSRLKAWNPGCGATVGGSGEGGPEGLRRLPSALALFVCLCLLSIPALLHGQAFTSLNGTVLDPSGAAVPGTSLTLENVDTGAKRTGLSDASGNYAFPQLTPGPYKLTGKHAGFADVLVNNLRLLVNQPATVTVQFETVGSVTEVVSVSAEAIQINTTDASLGNAIGTKAIMDLPFYVRNVAQLLAFQPGVTNINSSTADTDYVGANPSTFGQGIIDDRNGAVNGGKSDQSNITLDGVDVNDQQSRRAFKGVLRSTLDSVQEFRTTTLSANSDQGRSSGAQVALVTKSGSNVLHGSLYEYHRNTVTAANSFFNNQAGVKKPALLVDVFGGSVGGPIRKNRAFFFLNYEGRRDRSATNILRNVPSDKMRQGIVQYQRTDNSIADLSPADIKARVDPAGIGVSPASLALLSSYPHPNDFTVGDGLNIVGYRFTAGQHTKFDTYIGRFDYYLDSASKHQLFWRGNLQNDHASGVPQFPGDPPRSVGLDNSKGFALGYTGVWRPNLISSTRFGLTRQGAESTGIQNSSATTFRNLDTRYALTKGVTRIIPVNNVTQDFDYTHGAHSIRVGGVMRWTENRSSNFTNSFNGAIANLSWLRGTGSDLQAGVPDLNSRFRVAYGDAMMAVLGIITQGNGAYNYDIQGNVLPTGAPVKRRFRSEEYEMYAQDTWRVSRALTVTYGLRYSLMPPVYEADGVQISSNISLGDWFNKRGELMQQGRSQKEAGLITYVLANSPEGRPLYDYHKKNLAPRISLAYSPQGSDGLSKFLFGGPGRTSIRAGWGMYYDLFGQGIMRAFDSTAFGLSTSLTNSSGQITSLTAPRFTGFYDVPAQLVRAAPSLKFPVQQPVSGAGSFAITNSVDDRIKPPYNMNLNFSIGREFKGGLFIQGAYVGRLSRRSLVSRDLAMPTDLKDPGSGVTYFQAATQMAQLVKAKTPTAGVGKIPYWENLFPGLATASQTATQVILDEFKNNTNDWTSALADLDQFNDPGCSRLGCNALFSSQFSALGALSSIGGGNYHGMQWTVRKRFSSGLLFDFNYTWSKSIDISSNSENANGPNGPSTIGYAGFLVNPWNPRQRRAVSDYDLAHIYNGYMIWELPFGRGKHFGNSSGRGLNALIGGWMIAPTISAGSGLPISVGNGRNWPTNWNVTGNATQIGPIGTGMGATKNAPAVAGQGGPNIFANPSTALAAYDFTLPGQSGQRNGVRGDGPFAIGLGVSKRFVMPYNEAHSLQFRWETFNLTNTVRFNVSSLTLDLGNTGSFGKYSGALGPPRQMQFALRYEF